MRIVVKISLVSSVIQTRGKRSRVGHSSLHKQSHNKKYVPTTTDKVPLNIRIKVLKKVIKSGVTELFENN